MGIPQRLATLLQEEYHASQPSGACLCSLLSFVENTPDVSSTDPFVIKRLVKAATKVPASGFTSLHLQRLHEYAHTTAQEIKGQRGLGVLYAHLHRDAADIIQKQYALDDQLFLAKEALADYRCAAYGVDAQQESVYAIATLVDRLAFASRVSVQTRDCVFVDEALRDLARYPKQTATDGAIRCANTAITQARAVSARVRR